MRTEDITWEQVQKACQELAVTYAVSKPKPDGIVAVSRGGLVPATIIANLLKVTNIEVICLTSYVGKERTTHTQWTCPTQAWKAQGMGWLVIDDLVDSGETFKYIRKIMPQASFVCLYAKPLGLDQTDGFVQSVPQDLWLNFPWEVHP